MGESMNKAERIQAIEGIIKGSMFYKVSKECSGESRLSCDDVYELATAIEEAIGVDETKTYNILMDSCDSNSDEAIMYSEIQAKAISTNKEVIKIGEK